MEGIGKIYNLFSNNVKSIAKLLIVSLLVALFEVIGVVAIMPFISVASDFGNIMEEEYLSFFYIYFGFSSDLYFVIALGSILILFYLFKGFFNIYYYANLAKISRGQYSIIATEIFKNFLNRKYIDFLDQSNASLTKSIVTEAQGVTTTFVSFFLIMSELLVLILIISIMLYQNFLASLIVFLILIANVILIKKTISKKINAQGVEREKFQKEFFSSINTSFGNFKISKLSLNPKIILKKFRTSNLGFTEAQIKFETLVHIPRVILETLGFSVVIILVLYLLIQNNNSIVDSMPIITMFVLGLYRLLPAVNRIITNYNNIEFYSKSLDIVLDEINHPIEEKSEKNVVFSKKIVFENINFSYKDKLILNNVSFTINKGEKIAFIGASGSGKSTLADIIMGLHTLESGNFLVDENQLNNLNIDGWRSKIGYIPQNIYLFEGTVLENIAFGRIVDEKKARAALKSANILEFLELNHEGINTQVGDFGVKLSGGQKQRVAIARAIYGNPEVLILDEATSALDESIERKVMSEIYQIAKNKILIVIAHRLSTIKDCDKVYLVKDKKVSKINRNK
jgi:ABC-type multidrug transport system fused ATPase/permease subunit